MEVFKVSLSTVYLMYFGLLYVIFGIGFFIAWHALDPKLHARKDPPQ